MIRRVKKTLQKIAGRKKRENNSFIHALRDFSLWTFISS